MIASAFHGLEGRLPRNTAHTHFEQIGSTNAAGLDPVVDGTVHWITSDRQSAGRGRRGREWSSPIGNLYATAVLDAAHLGAEVRGILPLVAALALCDAVTIVVPKSTERVQLKWPNDLLLDGRKVAGLLLEARASDAAISLAVGFGVNCIAHPHDGRMPATDFASAGLEVTPAALFVALAHTFERRLQDVHEPDYIARNLADWRARARGIGEPITVRLPDREIDGTFQDLAPDGRLILIKPDGRTETIAAGDVFFANMQGTTMNTTKQTSGISHE